MNALYPESERSYPGTGSMGRYAGGRLVGLLPFILLFALTNAIVKEAILRFSLVATLAGHVEPRTIALLSGAIFGAIHFFGVPGGPLGVALAGFLGWLLAKSILETRGVQWALTSC